MKAYLWALALVLGCGERPPREFDGSRAFTYLEAQVAFGPRIPNTDPHRKTGDWILEHLRARADSVEVQSFTHVTLKGDTLRLRNFLARFNPSAPERILYLAHWDTRPHADQSPNLGDQQLPVLGANDGASGVALLLGVADALKAKPSTLGVDLLFVDGEDYGDFTADKDVLIGSRYFAGHLVPGYKPLFAVLFDMIGDRDLQVFQEGNSAANAPEVVERVWSRAEALGYGRVFRPTVGYTLIDDHVSLQQAGLRTIDVVDFNYGPNNGFWHTTGDTPDKVSAASLQIVGDVAMALLR